MSDDSFIREVDEELRSDRMQNIWKRYGKLIIAIAIAIVLVTAGYRFWLSYSKGEAAKSGDVFLEAVELSNDGKHDDAIAMLEQLSKDGYGQYPALSQIRLAAEMAKAGKIDDAVAAYDAIADDTSFDPTLRGVARLRSGLLLVDHGSFDDVASKLQQLSGAESNFRHSAREGLGLSAWKHKQYSEAHRWFTTITEDATSPNGIRGRARIMLELLAGEGVDGKS